MRTHASCPERVTEQVIINKATTRKLSSQSSVHSMEYSQRLAGGTKRLK